MTNPTMVAKVGDKVLSDRLGEGEFEVLEVLDQTREYRVRSMNTKQEQKIFQAHCHATVQMRIRDMKARTAGRIERANKIGRPQRKPGK